MTDCVFCKIISGKVTSELLHQDGEIIAFRDIELLAPVHLLVVPKRHIPSLAQVAEADLPLIARMIGVANQLAKREGLSQRGYRVVINCGPDGAQVVPHLHLHLLGGRKLSGMLG